MEQFTIPQFIEVEDKIFGPITVRQFGIMLSATGMIFVAYKLADTSLFILLALLIGGSSVVIAFVKINGQPFHFFLLNIFQTIRRPSRRVWNKSFPFSTIKKEAKASKNETDKDDKSARRALQTSKIRDLSLLVNTGGYYKPE